MVTMPSEAATDVQLIRDLLSAAWTSCASTVRMTMPEVWARMVRNLRRAENESTGKRCTVSFDLAGPKLRTGPIEAGGRRS